MMSFNIQMHTRPIALTSNQQSCKSPTKANKIIAPETMQNFINIAFTGLERAYSLPKPARLAVCFAAILNDYRNC